MSMEFTAQFSVGQIIQHRLFEYRGVIIDVDPEFHGNDTWYQTNAYSRPPKDRPWYHVLVDGGEIRTYVAERNLEPDTEGGPINHPDIVAYFEGMDESGYVLRRQQN
jgi:heat shock protein HspQ